jgi:hypothetical protein
LSGALSFGGGENGFFELAGSYALNFLAKFSRPCMVQLLQSLKPRQKNQAYGLSKSANESDTRTRRSEKKRDSRSRRLLTLASISFSALAGLTLPKQCEKTKNLLIRC